MSVDRRDRAEALGATRSHSLSYGDEEQQRDSVPEQARHRHLRCVATLGVTIFLSLHSPKENLMQRYEYNDDKSSKFWEVQVDGNDLNVCYGRIGTDGQTKTKTFGDAAAANKERDKLIKEKTGKGYVLKR
jgi:predicted DNA-binding WGR domain protein